MTKKIEGPWFGEIVRKLERVRPPPKLASFLDVDAFPEWLIEVSRELFQQSVPSAPLAKFKEDTPNSVGLWLGQSAANFYAVGEALQGNMTIVEKNPEKVKAFQEKLAADAAKPDVQNLLRVVTTTRDLLEGVEKHCSQLQKLILRAFKLALDQENYQEAAELFQGFAKGFSKKGLKGNQLARKTDATGIYTAMFFNWKTVDSLKSVAALRNFLLQIGFSEDQLGDPERLNKLCYRVKYRPGKRGRPSKSDK